MSKGFMRFNKLALTLLLIVLPWWCIAVGLYLPALLILTFCWACNVNDMVEWIMERVQPTSVDLVPANLDELLTKSDHEAIADFVHWAVHVKEVSSCEWRGRMDNKANADLRYAIHFELLGLDKLPHASDDGGSAESKGY